LDCGTVHPLGYRLECEKCRGLLELSYDLDVLRARGPAALTGGGLWRYAPVLPIADPAHRVTLGEGGTPLLDCPRLAKRLGVRSLAIKFEGANPTGTVKDRSSATGVAAALQFGFTATSVVSSGNAGSSIAAYSARAGFPRDAPCGLHPARAADGRRAGDARQRDLARVPRRPTPRAAEDRLHGGGGTGGRQSRTQGRVGAAAAARGPRRRRRCRGRGDPRDAADSGAHRRHLGRTDRGGDAGGARQDA